MKQKYKSKMLGGLLVAFVLGMIVSFPLVIAWSQAQQDITASNLVFSGDTFPSSPEEGTIFYLLTDHKPYVYNGTHWNEYKGDQGPKGDQGDQGPQGPPGTGDGSLSYSWHTFVNDTAAYMVDGETGAMVWQHTDHDVLVNAALDNATLSGGIVLAKAGGIYEFDALVTVHEHARLKFEHGAEIRPLADVDLIKVECDGQLVGGLFNTTGIIPYSSAVIILGEGSYYPTTEPHDTLVYGVMGKGNFGVGNGTFLYLHPTNNNGMAFCNFERIKTEGYEFCIKIFTDSDPGGFAWCNSNKFRDITAYDPVNFVWMEKDETAGSDEEITANVFEVMRLQPMPAAYGDPSFTLGFRVTGSNHIFNPVTFWDMTGSPLVAKFTEYSAHCTMIGQFSNYDVSDLGYLNTIVPVKHEERLYSFHDDFEGSDLSAKWTTTGTWVTRNIPSGKARGTTGTVTGNSAELSFNNKGCVQKAKHFKAFFGTWLVGATATNYRLVVGLRASNENDQVVMEFSTDIAEGAQYECVNGGTNTTVRFSYTHNTNSHWIYIICDGVSTAFFLDAAYIGTISTNIPTTYLQPYFYIETRTDEARYGDIDLIILEGNRMT